MDATEQIRKFYERLRETRECRKFVTFPGSETLHYLRADNKQTFCGIGLKGRTPWVWYLNPEQLYEMYRSTRVVSCTNCRHAHDPQRPAAPPFDGSMRGEQYAQVFKNRFQYTWRYRLETEEG